VKVSLDDGRSASRDIADGTELLATLKGLLFLPPAERTTEAWVEPPTSPDEAPHAAVTARSTHDAHFEVGLGAMGRTAGSPLYLGIGAAAFAQANLGCWLFGVVARWTLRIRLPGLVARHRRSPLVSKTADAGSLGADPAPIRDEPGGAARPCGTADLGSLRAECRFSSTIRAH
jgi:hypothetical protein